MNAFRLSLSIGFIILFVTGSRAADEWKTISIHPTKVALTSGDDAAQLIVTGTRANGRLQDLTRSAKYTIADASLARVTERGRVLALANGSSVITATVNGKSITVPVTITHVGENLPINFANEVVPIFTKLGCNSGGCHGKGSGQNGFKLSLLGFDPTLDYETLLKEGRGRRLFPAAPDQSLLLTKATGILPHGGGRKMTPDSDEYKVVRRWIASGMPYGKPSDPTVTRISITPDHRILTPRTQQQFAVYAHYSDGTVEDITRRAQYESNDDEIADVDGEGLVGTHNLSGEAAIMARYQGHVAVFRATVPLAAKTPTWTFAEKTLVDKYTAKKWRELNLVPSELCSDEIFLRRVSLDITGTLPTPKQVTAFLADTAPDKRDRLIDRLLESPEYAYFFANKWADILRVKRRGDADRALGTFTFHNWLREAIDNDLPYDDFARAILGATGTETQSPPTVWYKELSKPEQFVDDVAQVFLGQRLACAQCHHHPFEKWSQDDYWGLAGFFGRIGRKNVVVPSDSKGNRATTVQVIYTLPTGTVINKRTNQPAAVKVLDGEPMGDSIEGDPRVALAEWMVDPKNPFFAKAVANRYWAHFFGRGIVDPLDDLRVTNPPSNPELLDALTQNLIDNKYSLKTLIKTICKSRTYQLSAIPNEYNVNDKQAYARYYPKRLSAEVLLDALNQVTHTEGEFRGLPTDRHAPNRAIMLPDESYASYFLDVFGRPQRSSACECERVNEANLAQALHMMNSDDVNGKITSSKGRAALLAAPTDTRSDAEKINELFLWVFGRKPTPEDQQAALSHLAKSADNKKLAYENIIWALLNTKEFMFNQ